MSLPEFVMVMGARRPITELQGGKFYHGTCPDLSIGTVLTSRNAKNFEQSSRSHVSITSVVDTAWMWAKKVSDRSQEKGRFVYEVEPMGEFLPWRVCPTNMGRNFDVLEARVTAARIIARVELKFTLPPRAPAMAAR